MNTQKGFANILMIILGLLVIGGGAYLYVNNDNLQDFDKKTSSVDPSYDFLYTVEEFKEGVYSENYIIEDGNIKTIGDVPKLYIYNIDEDTSVPISLEEANKLIINQSETSPDGYSIYYKEDYENKDNEGFYIADGVNERKINIKNTYGIGFAYSRSFRLFGWIEEGSRGSINNQQQDSKVSDTNQNNLTVCTQDAIQCPDGSFVGRTGPDCEFVCPEIIKENLEIKSLNPLFGQIGDYFELEGYNLLDSRGDQNIVIENSSGEVGYLGFGSPRHLNIEKKYVVMSFELPNEVCTTMGTDLGVCTGDKFNIVPGNYEIYVVHGGLSDLESNRITITVKDYNKEIASLVSRFRASAELHHIDNNDTYSGVCEFGNDGSPGSSKEVLKEILNIVSESDISCNDADNKWSLSVKGEDEIGFYCSDSTGFSGILDSTDSLSCN